jgi:hypothetical protein
MADEQELFIKGDTDGEYAPFTPPTFAEQIPEEHREALDGIEDLGGLAEKYVTLKSAQPVIPEEYELPEIPDELNPDQQALDDFVLVAKELGLTQAQVNKIIEFDLNRADKYQQQALKAHEELIANNESLMKSRWGANYDSNKEMASSGLRKVLKTFKDGDKIEEELTSSGFLDQPSVMRLFRKIGQVTSEDVFRPHDAAPVDDRPLGIDGRPRLKYPSMGDT